MLKDIHTHHAGNRPEERLVNRLMPGLEHGDGEKARYVSLSLHPWYLDRLNLKAQLEWMESRADDEEVMAIGEAGLDKRCLTPFDLQTEAFGNAISLSEKHGLPLIIHCVKAYNEVVEMKRKRAPKQPWIIHGFRGKRELMEMLLHHGLYLSFGEKYQEECMKTVPDERLLIETDESPTSIETLYEKAARLREVETGTLMLTIENNIRRVFGRIKL